MFSPQGFPDGQIVYDLATSLDREHENLEGFELHRRTFAVIAIADHQEANDHAALHAQYEELKFLVSTAGFARARFLMNPANSTRTRFTTSVSSSMRRLMVFHQTKIRTRNIRVSLPYRRRRTLKSPRFAQ